MISRWCSSCKRLIVSDLNNVCLLIWGGIILGKCQPSQSQVLRETTAVCWNQTNLVNLASSDDQRGVGASVWYGGAGASAHLFLADEAPVHAAGGVVPAPDRHSLQHTCFHDVAAVLVDVVVGLAHLPKSTEDRKREKKHFGQQQLNIYTWVGSANQNLH